MKQIRQEALFLAIAFILITLMFERHINCFFNIGPCGVVKGWPAPFLEIECIRYCGSGSKAVFRWIPVSNAILYIIFDLIFWYGVALVNLIGISRFAEILTPQDRK